MQIRSVSHLGQVARQRRLDLDLSQEKLAHAADVSRQWVVAFEAGKPTAEIGNALRVIRTLGLAFDLSPAPAPSGEVDIDRLLDG